MGSCWFSLLLPTSCAPQPPRRSSVSSCPSRRALPSTTVHALDWPIQGTPAAVAALLPSTRGGHWVTSSPAFSLTVPAHFQSHSGQPCVPAPSLRVGVGGSSICMAVGLFCHSLHSILGAPRPPRDLSKMCRHYGPLLCWERFWVLTDTWCRAPTGTVPWRVFSPP